MLKSERDSSKTGRQRLAVETTIHPLNYALFEGVGCTGTTGVWDIGEYRVSELFQPGWYSMRAGADTRER